MPATPQAALWLAWIPFLILICLWRRAKNLAKASPSICRMRPPALSPWKFFPWCLPTMKCSPPAAVSIAKEAPKEVIEEVHRAEAEKQAEKEAIEAERERARKEKIIIKRSRWMMVIGFISLASVLLSIFLLINATHLPSLLVGATHLPFQMVEPRNSVRFLLALVIPCMCLLAAFAGKRKNGIIKAAFIICMVLFALQIVSIVACSVVFSSTEVSEETRYLASKFFRYVNGADFGMMLKRFMWVLRSGRGSRILQALENFAPSFFAVLPNLLCTAVLAVSSKKIK